MTLTLNLTLDVTRVSARYIVLCEQEHTLWEQDAILIFKAIIFLLQIRAVEEARRILHNVVKAVYSLPLYGLN